MRCARDLAEEYTRDWECCPNTTTLNMLSTLRRQLRLCGTPCFCLCLRCLIDFINDQEWLTLSGYTAVAVSGVHEGSRYFAAGAAYLRAHSPVAVALGAAHLAPSGAPLAHTNETSSSSSPQLTEPVPVTTRNVAAGLESALAPAIPAGPGGPAGPCGPGSPRAPAGPVGPCAPGSPCGPWGPI